VPDRPPHSLRTPPVCATFLPKGPDSQAQQAWGELGLPVELLGPEDNWWSNGPTGPCGPDSEIHVWTGDGRPSGTPSTDDRWLELWNHVTMRYERQPGGSLTPLSQPGVDTGMGLERLLMVSQQAPSVYETDLFAPWLPVLLSLWRPDQRSLRRLYPSGTLAEQDYEFLRDTHGLPRELVTALLDEPEPS
jgi:alanyl-tRNA synthetase